MQPNAAVLFVSISKSARSSGNISWVRNLPTVGCRECEYWCYPNGAFLPSLVLVVYLQLNEDLQDPGPRYSLFLLRILPFIFRAKHDRPRSDMVSGFKTSLTPFSNKELGTSIVPWFICNAPAHVYPGIILFYYQINSKLRYKLSTMLSNSRIL